MARKKKAIKIRLNSDKIAPFRAKTQLSKGELAKGAGIGYQYLSNLLGKNPRSEPSLELVGKLAQVLGAEPWQIADGLESPIQIRETQAPYGLSEDEIKIRKVIELLKENPQMIDLCLNFLGRGQSLKDALEELQKILGPIPDKP